MIGEPPSLVGTIHSIVVLPPVPAPVMLEGLRGTPAGVTAADAADADAELPVALVAIEVNV